MTGSRNDILGALEGILGAASDKHLEELDRALLARRETYSRSYQKMPTFLRELINTLESECGYRFRMEEDTEMEDPRVLRLPGEEV